MFLRGDKTKVTCVVCNPVSCLYSLEVATNILVGLVVSFISQVLIFSAYDVHLSLNQNLTITLYFTAISIVRGYALETVLQL